MPTDDAPRDPYSAVLLEALGSLLAPDVRGQVLSHASGGGPLAFADPSDALTFLIGPLLGALEREVGPSEASVIVEEVRRILEPLTGTSVGRHKSSGERMRATLPGRAVPTRGRTTEPARAMPASNDDVADTQGATAQAHDSVPTRPPPGRAQAQAPQNATGGFDDVPTADLPDETLSVLRARDTLGPPALADAALVVIAEGARSDTLRSALGDVETRCEGADEDSLLRLLAESLPAGTVFVLDCAAGASAHTFALHLSRLPRRSTVVVWGSESADLSHQEMACLGFIPASSMASARELAEMLRGLRAA